MSEIPPAECGALVALYTSTDGANWSNNSGWMNTTSPCSWSGVTCSTGHITELTLSSTHLTGGIPPELGNLASLQKLYLHGNPLSGPLPQSLTQLGLTAFYFDQTDLCEPPDAKFQAWLDGVSDLQRQGVPCVPGFGTRSNTDRTDDITGPQIHVMYVLPSDGADRQLDSDGTIATSVAAFQKWLKGQTAGRSLAFDTYQGDLDISFLRLGRTDSELQTFDEFVRDEIESEIGEAGFNQPNKIYAVYYDGGSNFACGAGSWPPDLSGYVAAVYLRGTPPGSPSCDTNALAAAEDQPAYWEFSMLNAILHTMGFVAP